jgi:predicted NBD/HSP70 family sugar kinase
VINPERVIVGGEMSAAGEKITGPITESVRRAAIPSAAEEVEVVPGVLGERAEMLGALALVLRAPDRFVSPAAEAGMAA